MKEYLWKDESERQEKMSHDDMIDAMRYAMMAIPGMDENPKIDWWYLVAAVAYFVGWPVMVMYLLISQFYNK